MRVTARYHGHQLNGTQKRRVARSASDHRPRVPCFRKKRGASRASVIPASLGRVNDGLQERIVLGFFCPARSGELGGARKPLPDNASFFQRGRDFSYEFRRKLRGERIGRDKPSRKVRPLLCQRTPVTVNQDNSRARRDETTGPSPP